MLKAAATQSSLSHKERLSRLTEKMGEIKLYAETEKSFKSSTAEQRLRQMEEQLDDYQETFSKKMGTIRENICSLQKSVETERKENDLIIKSDIQDLQSFEQRLQSAYEIIKQKRRDHENGLNNLVEDRTRTLAYEIEKENTTLQDEIRQLTQIYSADLKKLNMSLTQETVIREEGDNKTAEYNERELKRLEDILFDLRKYSENAEKKIFDVVKSSVTEIKILLDNERNEREKTHDGMINLLETAMRTFGNEN